MEIRFNKNVFNPVYYPLLKEELPRYLVLYGGAGSGKSFFAAEYLIIKALKSKRKILVLRKVGNTIKRSVFQLLLDILSSWKLLPYCKINRTDFTIELYNGSSFLFAGLDDPEKIKSITGLTDAWLEEATEFSVDDFSQIDLRIRHETAKDQMLILSFNPVSKANWCYKNFFSPEADEEFLKKCRIIKTNYLDNPHLPQTYVDTLLLLEKTNPAYYKIYCLGEFGSLEKLIYNNWQIMDFDANKIKGQLMCGLDFGYSNDPSAFVASLLVPEEQRIYVFKEWGGTGYLNDEIAKNIKEMGFAKSLICADSAENKSIDEIKRAGIRRIFPCAKGKGSILQGIQKLQQYELIIHPSCEALIEELQNYSWKKDKQTNEYVNEPIDLWNHYLDALRYSTQCVEAKPQLQSIKKDLLL